MWLWLWLCGFVAVAVTHVPACCTSAPRIRVTAAHATTRPCLKARHAAAPTCAPPLAPALSATAPRIATTATRYVGRGYVGVGGCDYCCDYCCDSPAHCPQCTTDTCSAGSCNNAAVSEGTSCGGSNVCTAAGACVACVSNSDCDDSNDVRVAGCGVALHAACVSHTQTSRACVCL